MINSLDPFSDDFERSSFIINEDSFQDILIEDSGIDKFYYFKNKKKLIKHFILKKGSKSQKSCDITLIKKENGMFTPRFNFYIWNTTKKLKEEFERGSINESFIKSNISLEDCYQEFLKLLGFLRGFESIEFQENSFRVIDKDSLVVSDENKSPLIKKIIESGYDEEFLEELVKMSPDVATQFSYLRIFQEKNQITEEFKIRLSNSVKYYETKGSDSWQKWIYDNSWLFGVNYQQPIEKAKINFSGIMPDFLFPTIDGFVDILEIKLPDDEVLKEDSSHPGSWILTVETNKAVGQVINYIHQISDHRLGLEQAINRKQHNTEINLIKPRAYILIGDSKNWKIEKKEGLRNINATLHGIEILTYRELLERGEQVLAIYKKKKIMLKNLKKFNMNQI
jgi:hypothetical protein